MITKDDFTRADNNTNGNPRFVCHFLSFTTPSDLEGYMGLDKISRLYDLALSRAKPLGGRKFHNKQFGGGIVFSTYNLRELCEKINETLAGESCSK
jgi:hypothetical protein